MSGNKTPSGKKRISKAAVVAMILFLNGLILLIAFKWETVGSVSVGLWCMALFVMMIDRAKKKKPVADTDEKTGQKTVRPAGKQKNVKMGKNTVPDELRCVRCMNKITERDSSFCDGMHICAGCVKKTEILQMQLEKIDAIINEVIPANAPDADIQKIKNKATEFLERYIKKERVGYTFYDFSPYGGSTSAKRFEKSQGIWCIIRYDDIEEPYRKEEVCSGIDDENLLGKFIEILLAEEKLAKSTTLIRYEKERTDKDGRIYLGSVGDWFFSEYYFDKVNNEFIEEKYHHEYLDTGTVFDGSYVVSLQQISELFADILNFEEISSDETNK